MSVMNTYTIPEDATDYTRTPQGYSITYYKRFKAFNMNLLCEWNGREWFVASYLPWDNLKPISDLKE
jgi:hypothetical protein